MLGSRQPFSLPVSPGSLARELAEFERAVADLAGPATQADGAATAARRRLAHAYVVTGRNTAAIDLLTDVLAASGLGAGADHPETVAVRNDLAWARQKAGLVADASVEHQRCIDDFERLLGPGSGATATARLDLGDALIVAGQRAPALDCLQRAMTDINSALGPEHPDALLCGMRLARALRGAGRLREAVEIAERTAAVVDRLLDPDDPEAISCHAALGILYGVAGRTADAAIILDRARADSERVLGPEHLETLRTDLRCAEILRKSGSPGKAASEVERMLPVAERVLGPRHPLPISARHALALCYVEAQRPADAIPVLERLIADFKPGTRLAISRQMLLSRAFLGAGMIRDAIHNAEQTLAECERAYAQDDKTTLRVRGELADLYLAGSQRRKAMRMYRLLLPDLERVSGPDAAVTQHVRERLGM
jgi:tetratricopeptide (TPR) repeat protein